MQAPTFWFDLLLHCLSYFLDKKFFEMPKKISHPCHKDHAFTLFTQPAYANGMFKCDACGENGDGFSYHCKPCGNDFHILCSDMSLSITHVSHLHRIELTFGSPYPTKDFCCDICKKVGSDHWIYRFNFCAFDAHLHCAKSVAPVNNMGFQSHQGPVPHLVARPFLDLLLLSRRRDTTHITWQQLLPRCIIISSHRHRLLGFRQDSRFCSTIRLRSTDRTIRIKCFFRLYIK